MAAGLCVAVVKYSHATGVKPDNTIPWTHMVASNLFLVLKGEDTHIQNGQLFLQVIQGNSALETIDVGELIDKSVEVRYGSQQAGITPQIEQLPIFGIHKEVFLALRYRLPDGQARRVQFRLQSAHECSPMVDILERRGMEFQQQRPRTGRPASARPEAPAAQIRPLTTQTYSAKGSFDVPAVPSKPSPFHLQALEAGGLSSQTPGDASGHQGLNRSTSRQPSLLQTTSKALRQALTATNAADIPDSDSKRSVLGHGPPMHPQHLIIRSDSEMVDRPGTAASHQTTLNRLAEDVNSPAYDNTGVERPLTSHGNFPSAHISLSSPNAAVPARATIGNDSAFSNRSSSLYQPSAPASLRLPETLEHEMPPRRELPFKRPGSQQSTSSRPSTSARSVTHFGAAISSESNVASSAQSPATKTSMERPATASPLKRAIAPDNFEPTKKALAVEARPQSHAALLSGATQAPGSDYLTASEGSFRRPSDLGDLLRAKKQSAERLASNGKAARTDSIADAAYELETPPGTSSSPTKSHAQTVYSSSSTNRKVTSPVKQDIRMRPVSPMHSAAPEAKANRVIGDLAQGADATSLADYAAQSQEDRQTILDEFMVSKLADPNFATLCEDLDSCWRRIALGL